MSQTHAQRTGDATGRTSPLVADAVALVLRGAVLLGTTLVVAGCASVSLPTLDSLKKLEIPANDPSFRSRVYAGAAFGNSRLDPDTAGTVFDVDDASALGTQLKLGIDAHNLLAFEIETAVLGKASLRDRPSDVSYTSASISALVYGFGGVQMRSRREGWSGFGRLGYGSLAKSSQVLPFDEDGTGAILGLGAEYGFDNGLGIRAELTRYDSDAFFTGLGAVWRFGTPGAIGQALASTARDALASEDTRVAEGGRALAAPGRIGASREPRLGAAAPAGRAAMRDAGRRGVVRGDADGDGVRDASDGCTNTAPGTSVDDRGCGLFDAVLGDVAFKSGSWWLNARARGALDDVAGRLVAFPEVRVEVLAHTDARGPADLNLALSARRAEAVVDYLRVRGVPELQLESAGAGETRPLASNDSEPGRRRNRRVELVTLSDLSVEVLAGRDIEGSVWHYPTTPRALETIETLEARGPSRIATTSAPAPVVKPALAAAMRTPAVAPRAAASRPRPAPLPRPGYVPGFRLGGTVEGLGFASSSTDPTSGSEDALLRVRAELERHPAARVALMAHTDASGDPRDDLRLSRARADAVLERLVALGVDRSRLEAEGYGGSLPLVQGVTDVDRARNRRIEIRVLR